MAEQLTPEEGAEFSQLAATHPNLTDDEVQRLHALAEKHQAANPFDISARTWAATAQEMVDSRPPQRPLDLAPGEGWWKASDGQWYAPEQHPNYQLPPPPQATQASHPGARVAAAAGPPTERPPIQLSSQPPTGQAPISPDGQSRGGGLNWWQRRSTGVKVAIGVVGALIALGAVGSTLSTDADPDADFSQAVVAGETEERATADTTTQPSMSTTTSAPPLTTTTLAPMVNGIDRENPIPLTERVAFGLETFGDAAGSLWSMSITGPGRDMTEEVLAENQFNDPPAEGSVFFAVPIALTLEHAEKEPLSTLFNIEFEYFGPSTLKIIPGLLDGQCGATPAGEFDQFEEAFVGGTLEGFICYEVATEDVVAGVLVTIDSNDGDRLFWSTSE